MEVDCDEEREDERGRCPCHLGHEGVVKDRDDDQEKGNIEDKSSTSVRIKVLL